MRGPRSLPCLHVRPCKLSEGAKRDDQDRAERQGKPAGQAGGRRAALHDGPLEGLKLIGFAIWERKTGSGRNVTFPARQYSVNGERRSFALLRPIVDTTAQDRSAS